MWLLMIEGEAMCCGWLLPVQQVARPVAAATKSCTDSSNMLLLVTLM
jgi:TRAP-type C4-dicarboxylate transport system permease large subunit